MIKVGSDTDCRHRGNSLSATHQSDAPPDKMMLLSRIYENLATPDAYQDIIQISGVFHA